MAKTKTKAKSKAKKAAPRKATISVRMLALGNAPKTRTVPAGTTLEGFTEKYIPSGWGNGEFEIRVNDGVRDGSYRLQPNDQIYLAPFVAGGNQ